MVQYEGVVVVDGGLLRLCLVVVNGDVVVAIWLHRCAAAQMWPQLNRTANASGPGANTATGIQYELLARFTINQSINESSS